MSHDKSPEVKEDNGSQYSNSILICDTNIVVKMYIFKATVMFDAKYSFGEVVIHRSVIDELEHWLNSKRQKYKKFGEAMIKGFLNAAGPKCRILMPPNPTTLPGKHRTLQILESAIPNDKKGQDTSETDRELLLYSEVNGANLATNEKTLTVLTRKVLGEDRIKSFGDMVVDLYELKLLSTEDVEAGLDNLIRYGERPENIDRPKFNCLRPSHTQSTPLKP